MPNFEHLFSSFTIKGMTLKNRIVMPGMLLRYSDENGIATERLKRFYTARAKGGCGLIITEAAYILPEAKFRPNQYGMHNDNVIPATAEMVEEIQKYGAKVCCQLHHAGRRLGESHLPGSKPIGPSGDVRCVFSGLYPRELKKIDIDYTVKAYADAAERAKKAGYDCVDIHAAHGYIINQFLSPYTNHRTDEYGGSVENRARFCCEIIRAVRDRVGEDYPILMRMNGCDHVPGGIEMEDAIEQAKLFKAAGVDLINLSGGIAESLHYQIPIMRFDDCIFVENAGILKKTLDMPIMAVGKIRTPENGEKVIAEGKADLVAYARAFLADPEWPNKAKEGSLDEITPCISCNMGCIDKNISRYPGVTCAVNPECGREGTLGIPTATEKKNVMVIGGGPAGLEASRVLALAGHKVDLYEKEEVLGGQARYATMAMHKEGMQVLLDYQIREVKKLAVNVHLGITVDKALVDKLAPDVVMIATGARPLTPPIPGVDSSNVYQSQDILEDLSLAGEKVIVIGGGLVGLETAETLAAKGRDVTVLEMKPSIATDLGYTAMLAILQGIEENKIKVETSTKVKEINGGVVSATCDDGIKEYEADTIVLAVGSESVQELIDELNGTVRIWPIGDVIQPRKAIEAIHDAYMFAARNI